jgi:hypothetical protein
MKLWLPSTMMFFSILSAAAQQPAGVGYGVGMRSCGEFAKLYAANPATEDIFFTWAQGFMSGLNLESVTNYQMYRDISGTDMTSHKIQIRGYCDSHPLAQYVGAVLDLYKSFPIKRQAAGDTSAPPTVQSDQPEAERMAQFNQTAAAEAQRHLDMYKAGHFDELNPRAIGWTIITANLCGVQTKTLMDAIRTKMARGRREDIDNFYFALNYGMGLRINPNFPLPANSCTGLDRVVRGLEAQTRSMQ